MTPTPTRLSAGTLIALLLVTAPARADFIPWSYTWSSSPGAVKADGNTGAINILPSSGTQTNGIKDVLAAQLQAVGSVAGTFTNAPYSLTVTIHDDASKTAGSLTFNGVINGDYTNGGGIHNKFSAPITQQLKLGQDLYTVTIGSFSAPGAPNSGTFGRIGADVIVTGPGSSQPVGAPEPGTLALAALGAGALFARRCWKKRRAEQPA
jgi:MYXO-CTERM domain-containing protein